MELVAFGSSFVTSWLMCERIFKSLAGNIEQCRPISTDSTFRLVTGRPVMAFPGERRSVELSKRRE